MLPTPNHDEGIDPERALKYAVRRVRGQRAELIEGVIGDTFHCWNHEHVRHALRTQLSATVEALDCITGSGDLDLPGSLNWYVPDLAVVSEELAQGGGSLVPDQTLLIVEITSESDAETDRVVKRRRYAEYGAPLYLLVDRLDKTVTLLSGPGRLGYSGVDGPHAFGTPVRLPEPFGIEVDTSGLQTPPLPAVIACSRI